MRIKMLTPLSPGYRVTSLEPPRPEMVLILRGKFHLAPGKPVALVASEKLGKLSDESMLDDEAKKKLEEGALILGQGSLTADSFEEGDPERTGQVIYPGDLAELKPKADVMLRGSCHAPGGGATSCKVGFGVGDRFYKELLVFGPRVWVDKLAGGKFTEPLRFKKLPIDYAHAFGGPKIRDNPVGIGHDTDELPYVEDPKHPIGRAGAEPKPVGFGPINPLWPLRANKLGKNYGDEYEATRAPWYASDYDWTAQNAAPADQQLEGYLRGDEPVRFVNLSADAADFTVDLPGIRPRAFAMLADETIVEAPLVLDTLFADLEDGFLYLTWRGRAPVTQDDLSDVQFLLFAHESLADAKKPAEVYREELRAFAADPIGLADNKASQLADLEAKLDSGELDRELDALDGDPLMALLAPLAKGIEGGDKLLEQIAEASQKSFAKSKEAASAVKEQIKVALRAAFDGPAGPRMVVSQKGEIDAKPMFKGMLREAASNSQSGDGKGFELAAMQEDLQAQIRELDLPGVSADDVVIPENLEPPEPAPGADFSGCDLTGKSFAGHDLSGCNFDGAMLRASSLKGCTLRGASFRGACLARADLRGADCTDADFSCASITKSNLEGADLGGAVLDQASLNKSNLADANLQGSRAVTLQIERGSLARANLGGVVWDKCLVNEADLSAARFGQASLARCIFRNAKLGEASFMQANIENATFIGCDLRQASFIQAAGDLTNFQGSNLRGTDFRYAKLPRAMLMSLVARGALFNAADMPKARFYRTVLRDAQLADANLLQADMRKVVLTDSDFRRASCFQATFTEAHGVDADFRKANIDGANFNKSHLVKKT